MQGALEAQQGAIDINAHCDKPLGWREGDRGRVSFSDMTVMKGRMFEYDLLQFNSERADDDGTPMEVRSGTSLISLPAKHLVILD